VQVLALDTATPYLVLGLGQAERAIRLERRHGERLAAELKRFLADASRRIEEIEAIAVGQGPGSYTGLRVGVAFALGLGRGLGVPVVGVDTLSAVAARAQGLVAAGLTARNGAVYAGLYRVEGGVSALEGPMKTDLQGFFALPGCHLLDAPPSGRALAMLGEKALNEGVRGVQPRYL